jgi:hypothetical protein
MTTRSPYAAIRALDGAVDRVAPRDHSAWEVRPPLVRGVHVSTSRARQLRATVRQLERCLSEDGVLLPPARTYVGELLNARNIDTFLEAAASGRWRDRPAEGELSWSSLATLRDCLKILGEEAGLGELVLPAVYRERLDLSPVVPAAQQLVLYRQLADMAARAPEDLDAANHRDRVRAMMRVRLLALVGVVLDTGARSAELRGMRVDRDLGEGLGTVTVRRRPQNATHLPEVVETYVLREGAQAALRWWLELRNDLMVLVQGGKSALWVAVRAGSGDPVPGLPLQEWGLERAYAKGVAALNAEMAGRWDAAAHGPWMPLPRRMEQLRRGVHAQPIDADDPAEAENGPEGAVEAPVQSEFAV